MSKVYIMFVEEAPEKARVFTTLEVAKAAAQVEYDKGIEPEDIDDVEDKQLEWTVEDNIHYGQLPYDNMPTIIVQTDLE